MALAGDILDHKDRHFDLQRKTHKAPTYCE